MLLCSHLERLLLRPKQEGLLLGSGEDGPATWIQGGWWLLGLETPGGLRSPDADVHVSWRTYMIDLEEEDSWTTFKGSSNNIDP